MMETGRIIQPIFFIGSPRSGTTLTFEAFARHDDLGFLTNYHQKFPRLLSVGLLVFLFKNQYVSLIGAKKQYSRVPKGNRILPRTSEAYAFWDYYTGVDFTKNYLLDTTCRDANKSLLIFALRRLLRWQHKQRFATKLTGPSRIEFLHSVFPDAKFIHIIRDGRAVVDSLLRVGFWRQKGGFDGPFWEGGLPEAHLDQWLASNRDPAVLAAVQWKNIIEVARREKKHLQPEQYLEIRYEDFVASTHDVLSCLYQFCGLRDSARAHAFLDKLSVLSGMNDKYRENIPQKKIDEITHAMQPLLGKIGYA